MIRISGRDFKVKTMAQKAQPTCGVQVQGIGEDFLPPVQARELMKQLRRDHILSALTRIDAGEVGGFSNSTKYDLVLDSKRYPPKRVIGIALNELSGLAFDPYMFKGGESSQCFKTLQRLDFVVVDKDGNNFQPETSGLLAALKQAEIDKAFDAKNEEDARTKIFRSIALRHGQLKFRQNLLAAYEGKCAITGCDTPEALEAAHILPFKGRHTNSVRNGLLLRADIHTLFDLGMFQIDPTTYTVALSPALFNGSYASLAGVRLRRPSLSALSPDAGALTQRAAYFHAGVGAR